MEENIWQCKNLEELDAIAAAIIKRLGNEKLVAFYGEMGAGKTTLIKALCKQLGVNENVSSPTFSLVNEYECVNGDLMYHFDFYRIKTLDEVFDMGYENYFESGKRCFIEWSEKIEPLLDFTHTKIFITVENEIRKIEIRNFIA